MTYVDSSSRRALLLAAGGALMCSPLASPPDEGVGGRTEIVSLGNTGAQATETCEYPSVSADGRYVVFETKSFDGNAHLDIFVRDRQLRSLNKVSRNFAGLPGNKASYNAEISGNGRFVAFMSDANNLVPGDTDGHTDVFRKDLVTGEMVRVSVSSTGAQGNSSFLGPRVSISADGNVVAFASEATNLALDSTKLLDVYVHNVALGQTELISRNAAGVPADGVSSRPSMSADGRFATFHSFASNMYPGGNGSDAQVYVRDLQQGTTEMISVSTSGEFGFNDSYESDISGDGRFVVFDSLALNLVPGDPNGARDVFVRDRRLGTTTLASASAENEWGNGESLYPRISTDGSRVAFMSRSTNLSADDQNSTLTDVFMKELDTGKVHLVSVGTHGLQGNNHADTLEMAGASLVVVFASSDNGRLVIGDKNATKDIFARDLAAPWPQTYCFGRPNSAGCTPGMSSSGTPSATAGSGFNIRTRHAINGSWGLFCYSLAGPDDVGFFDGTMCLALPWHRTPVVLTNGGGPPGSNCSGTLVMDFNAYIATGVDSGLVVGQTVWMQSVFRDGGSSFGFGLSDALVFLICP